MSSKTRRVQKSIQKGEASSFEKNMHIIGRCRCGAAIFCYSSTRKDTVFNVYCTSCGSVSDVRFPKAGDQFLIANGMTAVDAVAEFQKAFSNRNDFYDYAQTAPKSIHANDIHGELDSSETMQDQIERATGRLKNGQ